MPFGHAYFFWGFDSSARRNSLHISPTKTAQWRYVRKSGWSHHISNSVNLTWRCYSPTLIFCLRSGQKLQCLFSCSHSVPGNVTQMFSSQKQSWDLNVIFLFVRGSTYQCVSLSPPFRSSIITDPFNKHGYIFNTLFSESRRNSQMNSLKPCVMLGFHRSVNDIPAFIILRNVELWFTNNGSWRRVGPVFGDQAIWCRRHQQSSSQTFWPLKWDRHDIPIRQYETTIYAA
jgi:hypothetical protein